MKVASHHEFLGGEGADERFDILEAALRHLEGTGGHVQEGRAHCSVRIEFETAEEVVFLLFQDAVGEGDARGEDFRDAALHQFALRQLRVFQLIADGDLIAGPYQLGKILL